MKLILAFIIAGLMAVSVSAAGELDNRSGQINSDHISMGMIATLLLSPHMEPTDVALTILAAGILKEVLDTEKAGGEFDTADITSNMIGWGVAAIFLKF